MPVEVPQCPVCGASGAVAYETLTDRLLGHAGSWSLMRCRGAGCDAQWLSPRPADAELAGFYEGYHTHDAAAVRTSWAYRHLWPSPISARERDRRLNVAAALGRTGRVLEIGCGNGKNLRVFKEAGWDVVGQDVDPNAARAASDLLQAKVWSVPIEECPFDDASFDLIFTSHVLEHIGDPRSFLATVHRLLAPGGAVISYTPNGVSANHRVFGSRWRGLEAPRHLVLFGPQSLERAFVDAGFVGVTVSTFGLGGGAVAMESVLDPTRKQLNPIRPLVTVACQIVEDLIGLVRPSRRWELAIRASKS